MWSPNTLHWVLAALGALTAGATLVPVSTRFTGPEALDVISRSGARALFVATDFLGTDRLAALRAAAAAACGRQAGLARRCVVRVPGDWAGFRANGGWRSAGRAPPRGAAAAVAAGGRQRHPVHLGHHRAEQGRDERHRADPGAWPGRGPSARA